MSCFICSASHFNSVEDGITRLFIHEDLFLFPVSVREIAYELFDKSYSAWRQGEKRIKSIMDTLRDLNVICVGLAWNEPDMWKTMILEKEAVKVKTKIVHLNNIELYKAIQCIEYQIEIEHLEALGEVSMEQKAALFFLKEVKATLATFILCNSEDYEKAKWCVD